MDTETADAIERLGGRLDGVDRSLGARMDGLEHSLGARMDGLERSLGARMEGLEHSLDARMDALDNRIDTIEKNLRGEISESRRHAEILFESLRDDIRILADGFALLSSKIDRLA